VVGCLVVDELQWRLLPCRCWRCKPERITNGISSKAAAEVHGRHPDPMLEKAGRVPVAGGRWRRLPQVQPTNKTSARSPSSPTPPFTSVDDGPVAGIVTIHRSFACSASV
jgi:hypothetical protein